MADKKARHRHFRTPLSIHRQTIHARLFHFPERLRRIALDRRNTGLQHLHALEEILLRVEL